MMVADQMQRVLHGLLLLNRVRSGRIACTCTSQAEKRGSCKLVYSLMSGKVSPALTGPEMMQGLPSRGQQCDQGMTLAAAQVRGLHLCALEGWISVRAARDIFSGSRQLNQPFRIFEDCCALALLDVVQAVNHC